MRFWGLVRLEMNSFDYISLENRYEMVFEWLASSTFSSCMMFTA